MVAAKRPEPVEGVFRPSRLNPPPFTSHSERSARSVLKRSRRTPPLYQRLSVDPTATSFILCRNTCQYFDNYAEHVDSIDSKKEPPSAIGACVSSGNDSERRGGITPSRFRHIPLKRRCHRHISRTGRKTGVFSTIEGFVMQTAGGYSIAWRRERRSNPRIFPDKLPWKDGFTNLTLRVRRN
ncbi:hypothetical protein EV701_12560 [Chthoniobacter flavus]|nr:hypothetical protein EV701_12560 [Chthoniobacter flavus]